MRRHLCSAIAAILNYSVCNMKRRQAHANSWLAVFKGVKLLVGPQLKYVPTSYILYCTTLIGYLYVLLHEVPTIRMLRTSSLYKETQVLQGSPLDRRKLEWIVLKETCSLGRPQAGHRAPQMTLVEWTLYKCCQWLTSWREFLSVIEWEIEQTQSQVKLNKCL